MKIFLDTSDIKEINKYFDMGVIDGVTTNPSILLKNKVDLGEFAQSISPYPVSLEVTTDDLDEMVKQAYQLNYLSDNVVIKIPQENQFGEPCYKVIKTLKEANIRVNATVAMSLGQVIFSAKSGADYISIFAGRLGDEGGNAYEVIKNSVDWLNYWGFENEIIVGSIRSVADVMQAVKANANIITIPPEIMKKMYDHQYTRVTVRQFIEDSKK